MTFTVVVKEPCKDAEVRHIKTAEILETCQHLVGGYIQCVGIGPGISILCDEDGLAKGLPDNCGFVGTLVFVQDHFISDDEGYDWGSLDEDNTRKALAWCYKYQGTLHPDRDGGMQLITGDKEIADYRERLAEDAQSKIMEWQSL